MVRLHYGVANGSDALQEVLGEGFVGSFEGFNEVDAVVGLLASSINPFDAQRHCCSVDPLKLRCRIGGS